MNKSSQADEPKVPAIQRVGGVVMSSVLKNTVRTLDLRASFYDRSTDPSSSYYNQHVIFVFWHEYIYPLLPQWANCPLTLLVSQHRDAEWLNQAAIRMGYEIVRGSTNRGGSAAIRKLKKHSRHSSFAITPDGPRGPRRVMAPGPIFLASLFNMPIVPVGVGCDRPWRMKTWDSFAIPRPFSRVRVAFGPKIFLPRKRKADHDTFKDKIETMIHQLTGYAEDWAKTGRNVLSQATLGGDPSFQQFDFGSNGIQNDSFANGGSQTGRISSAMPSQFPPIAA